MGRSGRLAIGAIAASVAAGQVAPSHLGASVALALAALLLLGEARPRVGASWLLPLVLGAGLIAARLVLIPPAPLPLDHPPDGRGPWLLVVRATGSPRDGQQTATLATPPGPGPAFQVAATLPRYPVVTPGDRVVVEGEIRPRPDSPYGTYLMRIGAVGTVTARTLEIEIAPDDPGRRLEDLRRGAAAALTRVLPEPEAGLAAGILIGLRDLVDRDLAAAFTTAGVSHVVAISGWNIAIVAAAIAAMTGRLGRRRRSVVTIVAIVAYVAFAGASPSVVRAALMAGVVLLARESGRAGRAAAALGWAATLLLVSDPGLIGDAGFQLSSLATAGLIAWATPLTGWIETIGRGRLPHWLAESLGVSLAAQAATLPIVLVSFGRLAVLSPIVNLVVVPLVAPAMAVGLVALAGGTLVVAGVPPVIGAVLAAPGWVILRVLVAVVEAAAGLPFASVTLEPPLDLGAATAVAGGLVGLTWWRQARRSTRKPTATAIARAQEGSSDPRGPAQGRESTTAKLTAPGGARPATTKSAPGPGRAVRRAAIAALVVAVAVAGGVVAARPAGIARVSILDVGQGDAILVEGSRGGRLLIDGGPDPDRLLVELDRRIPPWDRRIDVVILSHPHEDHVAGLALLLERYRVARVFEPGMRGLGPGYAAWLRELGRPGAPTRLGLAAGDRVAVDEIALRVLWPIRGQVPITPPDGGTAINNVSIVLLGQVGERRFLLMGDVEEGIDPSLLAAGLPRVDLLKVAHHGSRTATTQAFVDATRPRVAVASAGAGNPYGHPVKATLDRLAASGARVLRTDLDGTVVARFEATGMTVRTEGGRPAAAGSAGTQMARAATERTPGFLCAIPVTAIVPEREPVSRWAGAPPDPGRGATLGPWPTVGYHRDDDGPGAERRRLPPALPGSFALVPATRTRRGGGGRLAGGPDRGPRDRAGSRAGRVGGAAARCRQGAPRRRCGARSPPRRRLGRMADPARTPGARGGGGESPGHAHARRGVVRALGGRRVARGTDRGLCRQAGGTAPRVDGRALRYLAPPLSAAGHGRPDRRLGSRRPRGSARLRRPPRGGCLPRGRGGAGRCQAARLDRCRAPGRPREGHMTTPALAFFWGDDELSAARAVDRFEAALATEHGAPMERWLLRGDRNTASGRIADLHARVATPVMFGGGTLAIVLNAGSLIVKAEDRDAFLAAIEMVVPGNALVILDASQSGAKSPTPKRLADAIAAAGGTVRQYASPKGGALAGWIEAEARERGLQLAPGASKTLAERIGGFVQEGDAERRQQTRIASMELDKLSLYCGEAPIGPDDVRALVAEAVPGSVWAFTDAVGERRVERALELLERLLEATPEPVLLAVLHRRIRELIETGDRLGNGERLPAIGKAIGVNSQFRMEKLRDQAKVWSVPELVAALDALVGLDAMVKGVPGAERIDAQRRMAFSLWVIDHAGGSRRPDA